MEIQGHTIQNGEPSPTNPARIYNKSVFEFMIVCDVAGTVNPTSWHHPANVYPLLVGVGNSPTGVPCPTLISVGQTCPPFVFNVTITSGNHFA